MTNDRFEPQVQLISMPWNYLMEPSLGLGVLAAQLRSDSIPCRVRNLNLFTLEFLKPTTYYSLANVYTLCDFLFTHAMDPAITKPQLRLLREKTYELLKLNLMEANEYGGPDGVIEKLIQLRQEVFPAWLDRCAQEIAESDATLVGFTCMFDQTMSSLALAKKIKELRPEVMIALGGYAVREPTGSALMKSFPWVDAICADEGETVITPLARASVGVGSLADIPGILYRSETEAPARSAPAPRIRMDDSPFPDYSDFYSDLRTLAETHRVDVEVAWLPVEASRGCWWGAAHHCVFCGIHDEDMQYRSRSADNVLAMLEHLDERYVSSGFRFSDYIMPYQFYKTLLPRLAELDRPYKLFTEIKANISRPKFDALVAAGFTDIQPGIESFSSAILRKMDKGVTAAQNVWTIQMGEEAGVTIHYNLLYGFPDETEEEVREMLEQLPKLFHLRPPISCVDVQTTRFSPLQANPGRFGIEPTSYERTYDLIFSKSFLQRRQLDLNDFAYYFERGYEPSPRLARLHKSVQDVVSEWRRRKLVDGCELWFEETDGRVVIYDQRRDAESRPHELSADEALVMLSCDGPVTRSQLGKSLASHLDDHGLAQALDGLDAKALLFRDEERVLCLATRRKQESDSQTQHGGAVGERRTMVSAS